MARATGEPLVVERSRRVRVAGRADALARCRRGPRPGARVRFVAGKDVTGRRGSGLSPVPAGRDARSLVCQAKAKRTQLDSLRWLGEQQSRAAWLSALTVAAERFAEGKGLDPPRPRLGRQHSGSGRGHPRGRNSGLPGQQHHPVVRQPPQRRPDAGSSRRTRHARRRPPGPVAGVAAAARRRPARQHPIRCPGLGRCLARRGPPQPAENRVHLEELPPAHPAGPAGMVEPAHVAARSPATTSSPPCRHPPPATATATAEPRHCGRCSNTSRPTKGSSTTRPADCPAPQ